MEKKQTRKAQKPQIFDKRLEPEYLIAGDESKPAPDYMREQYQKDYPGIPYDKSLETLNPEAYLDELMNNPDAQDVGIQEAFERHFASLKIACEQARAEAGGPPADEEMTMSDAPIASSTETASVGEGEGDVVVLAEELGKGKREEKTIHMVWQYRQSVLVKDPNQLAEPVDQDSMHGVEWIDALGLLEDKRRSGLLRLNCKWYGRPVAENTWEPFENVGENVDLPETLAKMRERCKVKAWELGLTFGTGEYVLDEDEGVRSDEELELLLT